MTDFDKIFTVLKAQQNINPDIELWRYPQLNTIDITFPPTYKESARLVTFTFNDDGSLRDIY